MFAFRMPSLLIGCPTKYVGGECTSNNVVMLCLHITLLKDVDP